MIPPLTNHFDIVVCAPRTSKILSSLDKAIDHFIKVFVKNVAELSPLPFAKIRAELVLYGSYKTDGKECIYNSGFIDILNERHLIGEFISSTPCTGAEGEKLNCLEALTYSMLSDWDRDRHTRQIILFIADSDSYELGECKECEHYPISAPDFEGFLKLWSGKTPSSLLQSRKMLVMLAPPHYVFRRLIPSLDCLYDCFFDKNGNIDKYELEDLYRSVAIRLYGD